MRIAVCGSAVVDMVLQVESFPRKPEKHTAQRATLVGGGCAANAAVAIARLGGQAQMLARLGQDDIGALIERDLVAEGVDCSTIMHQNGGQSAMSSVLVDAAGERQITAFRGANLPDLPSWTAQTLAPFDAALADTRWPEAAAILLAAARNRGVPGVLDGEAPVPANLLVLASHCAFSMQGLTALTGHSDAVRGLREIYPQSGGWICATDGPNGVFIHDETGPSHVPAFTTQVVDTLGAGDVWHGGFTLRLAEGASAHDAIIFANAVAALKCQGEGGRKATPSRNQVEEFLEERI